MIIYRILSFIITLFVIVPVWFILALLIFILDLVTGLTFTRLTDIVVPEFEKHPLLFRLTLIFCVALLDYIANINKIRNLLYF